MLGHNDEALPAGVRDIIVLLAQRQIALHSFLALEDVIKDEERAHFGVLGPADQAMAMLWAQNNNVVLEALTERAVVFGYSFGG